MSHKIAFRENRQEIGYATIEFNPQADIELSIAKSGFETELPTVAKVTIPKPALPRADRNDRHASVSALYKDLAALCAWADQANPEVSVELGNVKPMKFAKTRETGIIVQGMALPDPTQKLMVRIAWDGTVNLMAADAYASVEMPLGRIGEITDQLNDAFARTIRPYADSTWRELHDIEPPGRLAKAPKPA